MVNEASNDIEQRFLDRRDLFGLQFREGFVFFEVMDLELLKYRPYSELNTIQPDSNHGSTRLYDDLAGEKDEILFSAKGVEKVLHGGIGIYPENLRMYIEYPEGTKKRGNWPNLSVRSARNGDDYGNIAGYESGYDSVTDFSELYIPPGINLAFDFYNPTNEPVDPLLNLKFMEYQVRVLDPSNSNDLDQIARVYAPGSPMPLAPVGTLDSKTRFNMEDSWGVQPMSRGQLKDEVRGGSR